MERALEAISSPVVLASVGVAAVIIFTLYKFLVSPWRVLRSYGINGPQPLPIVGNYLTMRKLGRNTFLEQQMNKFGSVFGYYIGACPKVAITDVELAKEIMVKEFDNFRDRGMIGSPNLSPKALGISPGLVVASGDTWKTGRHALTPSFSGMKMKLMVPLLKRSSDVLLEKMGEFAESGESADVFKVYGAFTIETLIATAFGRYVNIQRGEADQLTDAANVVFRATEEASAQAPDVLIATLSTFPWLEPLVLHYLRTSEVAKSVKLMNRTAVGLIKARMESKEPPKVKDLLQLMIDATVGENGEHSSTKKLTSEQIAGFSMDFLLAGYETTATTLTYTTYLLAMNPDVQEKLQAEIAQYFEDDPEASLYEATQKIKYLEMVLYESMRMYTPIPKTQRQCHKTVTVRGVTIPEGTNVVIPINVIHHMPQYWPDPYKFKPERFTPEAKANRPQLAHMPFGWGPRNCIGLRFALLEAKLALIEILRKYSFVQAPDTVANMEQSHGLTSVPKSAVMVRIVPRAN